MRSSASVDLSAMPRPARSSRIVESSGSWLRSTPRSTPRRFFAGRRSGGPTCMPERRRASGRPQCGDKDLVALQALMGHKPGWLTTHKRRLMWRRLCQKLQLRCSGWSGRNQTLRKPSDTCSTSPHPPVARVLHYLWDGARDQSTRAPERERRDHARARPRRDVRRHP
jgi:hypothetical protein